ncbi:MAG: hypothetical protein LBC27_02290 [Spirochaetaceae bacterium]|nr:hypothetical protein [Spirochaetaceae bacterium]
MFRKTGRKDTVDDKKITDLLKYACENRQTVLEWLKNLPPPAAGLYRLKKMAMEKNRVSAKRRMMYAALNEDFLYQALFTD